MSINIDTAIGLHAKALDLRVKRTEIIAANLANEDTPGFKARDIDFSGELSRLSEKLGDFESTSKLRLMYRIPSQPSLDGNTVELSTEQTEFSRNSMDFQQSLTFLNAKFRGIKEAIEGR